MFVSVMQKRRYIGTRRVLLFAAVVATFVAGTTPICAEGAEPVPEYHLKTVFLYNLAKFIRWPKGALGAKGESVRIGVIDAANVRGAFSLISDETIRGRALELRTIWSPADADGCAVLFLNGDDERLIQLVLQRVGGSPVLTVGEAAEFNAWGGIIRFRMDGPRVRLDASQANARRAGLGLRAQLLQLCRLVDQPGPENPPKRGKTQEVAP